jgi:hypothetical protein
MEGAEACARRPSSASQGGCSFSRDVLPPRSSSRGQPVPPEAFEAYLDPRLLRQRRTENPLCLESWAFALSGALHHWVALEYRRQNLVFLPEHFSVEFLLSCYALGPSEMCGCVAADLPTALLQISKHGAVSFEQFPFVASGVLSRETFTQASRPGIYCADRSFLGTCRPCLADGSDYTESYVAASADRGGFRALTSCLPCDLPLGPRYYPLRPCLLAAATTDALVALVKRELARLGPLPAALSLDRDAFEVLNRGGAPLRVGSAEQGVFYEPARVSEDYQAVLLVAYTRDFWICRSSHGRGSFGYALEFPGDAGSVDNLFNVSMSLKPAVLVAQVLSCERMQLTTQRGDEAPRDLGPRDPLVSQPAAPPSQPLPLGAKEPAPPNGEEAAPSARRRERWAWALSLLAAALLLTGVFFAAVSFKDAPL